MSVYYLYGVSTFLLLDQTFFQGLSVKNRGKLGWEQEVWFCIRMWLLGWVLWIISFPSLCIFCGSLHYASIHVLLSFLLLINSLVVSVGFKSLLGEIRNYWNLNWTRIVAVCTYQFGMSSRIKATEYALHLVETFFNTPLFGNLDHLTTLCSALSTVWNS